MTFDFSRRVAAILVMAIVLTGLLSWHMQTSPSLASVLTSPLSPLSPLRWIPYILVGG